MAEDRITEKVYCYDHPSAYNNHDALAIAAMANNRNDDPMALAAMMNGGMGGQWNNPFIYLVWMMFAQRMWGNGWGNDFNGQGQQNVEIQNQLQAIRSQMQDNQNSNMIMDAIKSNDADIRQLSQTLNCDFNALQNAICDVRGGIDRLSGQVGFSAERIINAVNMGDCNVIQALKDCCCTTQKAILEMGYQSRLGQKDQMFATQAGFDRTNTGLERGFSSIAFQAQQDKCDIIRSSENNTQRIIDTLNNHWNTEQANKVQDLKFELSQERQNNFLASKIAALNGGGCGNHGNCGCGCGCGCGQ